MPAVYICLDGGAVTRSSVPISDVFGVEANDPEIFFSFESQFLPFQKYIVGSIPRTDLVVCRGSAPLVPLEIKLTALPDNTTCECEEKNYGSELVVRPDSIAYLASSIAESVATLALPDIGLQTSEYANARNIIPKLEQIINSLADVAEQVGDDQKPFLIQPVWKTLGKSPQLATHCLDVFVWSNAAMAKFITEIADSDWRAANINRPTRAAVWLYKMLLDIQIRGRFNHEQIVDQITYNTKNDKAFATPGATTNKYMTCGRLECPCITKEEIKSIILGGGQRLLSPERRFDAIICNSPDLFE